MKNTQFETADQINKKALNHLKQVREQFFTWIHYTDIHAPYTQNSCNRYGDSITDRKLQLLYRRAKYLPKTITETERQTLINQYDNSLKAFDKRLKHFFQKLENNGLLKNSTVVLTADHGEAFGENGFYEHRRFLTNNLLQVPLIVYGKEEGTVETPVSTKNIFRRLSITDKNKLEKNKIKASCIKRGKRKTRVIH